MMTITDDTILAAELAARVEAVVRYVVVPNERDPRRNAHGPAEPLVAELRYKARAAGLMTLHVLEGGDYSSQRRTGMVLRKSRLSPLGPLALKTAAPDEGNMYLLGRVATPAQKSRFLAPMLEGRARSAFFMTEPAGEGSAGSDPTMMQTTARRDGDHRVIDGRKAFITGAQGASAGIEADYVTRYFRRSGRDSISNIEFYLALTSSVWPRSSTVSRAGWRVARHHRRMPARCPRPAAHRGARLGHRAARMINMGLARRGIRFGSQVKDSTRRGEKQW